MCSRVILWIIFLTFHFYFTGGTCPREPVTNNEQDLHKDLFCAYDNAYPPVKDHNDKVNLNVDFSIQYVSFDSSEEMLSVQSFVKLSWKDPYLVWDPINYGNIKDIIVSSSEIWTPSVILINSQASDMEPLDKCSISYDGSVLCKQHAMFNAMCSTWLRAWPYDKQRCTLKFSSLKSKLDYSFSNSSTAISEKFENGLGWKLLNVTGAKTGKFLKFKFTLERDYEGISAIIIAPFAAIVIIAMISLQLDYNDDNRLALQCFSVFGHFMFLAVISFTIPKYSVDTPLILSFIANSLFMVFSSVLLTLSLSSLQLRTEPAPKILVALCRCMTEGPLKFMFSDSLKNDIMSATIDDSLLPQSAPAYWNMTTCILGNFYVIIYVIFYIKYFFEYLNYLDWTIY